MRNLQKDVAECYQPLFEYMHQEYDVLLTVDEMDEIISVCDTVNENLTEIYRVKCDVEGCKETASTQGIYYQELGYICLCSGHSFLAREGEKILAITQEAREREASRLSDKTLP